MTAGEIGCPPDEISISETRRGDRYGGSWRAECRGRSHYWNIALGSANCSEEQGRTPQSDRVRRVGGTLSEALETVSLAVRRCLDNDRSLNGNVAVSIRVFPDGSAVFVDTEPASNGEVGRCMSTVFSGVEFPGTSSSYAETLRAWFDLTVSGLPSEVHWGYPAAD